MRNKLNPCAKQYVFIGYFEFRKWYRCYDLKTQKLYIILDTSFHETGPYYLGEVYIVSLHGECLNEENVLLESGGTEFIELEKTE